ncbi:hypothetical protein [Pseudomonas sp. B392_1p]|uniref:hypothetical protein n=1 Tax=Pseudomonas sp. B392_1p TaxID=3457507 RepID=UPI003FD169B9
MTVKKLEVPPVAVTESMLEMACSLREAADAIEKGGIRAIAFCSVESGPDMFVTRSYAAMSGCITLTGGVYRLLQEVSEA